MALNFVNRRQALKFAGLGISAAPGGWFAGAAQSPLPEAQRATPFFTPGPRQSGEASDTKRLQRALDEAQTRGGGTVFIPSGHYVSGTLLLRSNVSVWLDNGAVLAMSPDNSEFLPPEKLPYDPGANQATSDFHVALFSGDNVEHIAIYGEGILECDRGVKGGGPKPIALRRCKYVSLHGITLRNAANYNISMLGCDFVDIDNVTILTGHADGIDPDCCRHVRISNCYVESADDSLCLKASGALGERGATEYVTVTNCVLRTASIHFKCGTESCGDFRHIAVSNCIFQGGAGMRHGNPGLAFYTVDEGAVEDIVVSNITMQDVGTPIAIIRGDRDRCAAGKGPGLLRGIRINNIIATGAKLPSVIAGLPGSPVEDITLSHISIQAAAARAGKSTVGDIPEQPKAYPQPTMFGELPASGLFLRHVSGLRAQDVRFSLPADEMRAEIVADDAEELRLSLDGQTKNRAARLWLNNVSNSLVDSVEVVASSTAAYRISGMKTSNIYLRGAGAIDWSRHLTVGEEVPTGSVHRQEAAASISRK
ncbi:MAG TPA: glycosyl hydrolase family 28 protein [Acidobacteriaceae bacterium]